MKDNHIIIKEIEMTITYNHKYLYNLVTDKGELILDKDYLYIYQSQYKNTFIVSDFIKNTKKYNIINNKGNIISDVWFDGIYDMHPKTYNPENNYYYLIKLDNKCNYIDINGNYLLDEFVPNATLFNEYGLAMISNYNSFKKSNILSINGKILLKEEEKFIMKYNNLFILNNYSLIVSKNIAFKINYID